MVFANIEYLFLLLLLVPYIVWYIMKRKKTEPTLQISDARVYAHAPKSYKNYLLHVPFGLRIITLILIILVLARPQTTNSWQNSEIEGIDIMLAIDVSTSMLAEDLKPNRLEAAKDVDSDFSGETAEKEQKEKTYQLPHGKLMKDSLTINSNRTEYGDGRAEIYDLGLFDQRGNLTNLLLKGEEFTIKEKIRFAAPIQSPIFTYTIKDKKGTDLTGTNTMFEGTDIKPVKAGDEYEVSFTQKMTLQGGEYLLSMSCTGFEGGEHVVYHRLYDVANITVISNKNTVGVYDMEPDVAVRLSPAGEAAKQAESLSADEAAQEDLQA